MVSPSRRAWTDVVAMAKSFFVSPMRFRAAAAFGVIVALLLLLNALNVANSYVGRSFITAISQRHRQQYVAFTLLYLGVFAASTLAGVLSQFVENRLALLWRRWLTAHFIDRYFSGHALDRVNAKPDIDNPDQRIAEDVRTFTSTLLSFVVMVVNSTLTTIAFAGVLWSITPALFVTGVLYALLGSLLTIFFGRRLVRLNNLQLKREADLRYALIHVRERAGPPTVRAELTEGSRVRVRLRQVVHNSRAIIAITRNVGFFTSKYNYLVQILPFMLVAPRYMRGEIGFGVLTQSAMAFAQLMGAFSLIVVQFQSISALAAVVGRLGSLWGETEFGDEARESIARAVVPAMLRGYSSCPAPPPLNPGSPAG
jgi:putative ATP-binding cassette transporter